MKGSGLRVQGPRCLDEACSRPVATVSLLLGHDQRLNRMKCFAEGSGIHVFKV